MSEYEHDKPLFWIGSSRDDLKDCPDEVQDNIGYALHWGQRGGKSPAAKPLQGFGGTGVLEVVDDFDGNTYGDLYSLKLNSPNLQSCWFFSTLFQIQDVFWYFEVKITSKFLIFGLFPRFYASTGAPFLWWFIKSCLTAFASRLISCIKRFML